MGFGKLTHLRMDLLMLMRLRLDFVRQMDSLRKKDWSMLMH